MCHPGELEPGVLELCVKLAPRGTITVDDFVHRILKQVSTVPQYCPGNRGMIMHSIKQILISVGSANAVQYLLHIDEKIVSEHS